MSDLSSQISDPDGQRVVAESRAGRKVGVFLQCYNELSTGHLQRFLDNNAPLWDFLYVYDDASSDGSVELLEPVAHVTVRGARNAFKSELRNKQALLDAVAASQFKPDWLLWLDADEVLYCDRLELEDIIDGLERRGADGARMPLVNLWRSTDFARVDNYFGSLTNVRLWRYSSRLRFEDHHGLHGDLTPLGLNHIETIPLAVVHYGFSTTDMVISKFVHYASQGQKGWALERLISEESLELVHVDNFRHRLGNRFPKSTEPVSVVLPMTRMQWYREVKSYSASQPTRRTVTIVSLIFRSVEWLSFVYGEMIALQRNSSPDWLIEILFVANDADPEVLRFLQENSIPYTIAPGKADPSEWYINSVYRAYNWGAQQCDSEFVFFINSDMAFSPESLNSLLMYADENLYLVSRLVELGRLKTGAHGIERDFGGSPKSFKRGAFQKFADSILEEGLKDDGLYMPALVNRLKFLELGGFPEGNLVRSSVEQYLRTGQATFESQGNESYPGDKAFILRAREFGLTHKTCFSSVVYHFQEGELKDASAPRVRSGVLIVNDHIRGINNEPVLWSVLLDSLKTKGLQVGAVSMERYFGVLHPFIFHIYCRSVIRKLPVQPRVVVANATYRMPLTGNWRLISIRQDFPKGRVLRALQNLTMRRSDLVVANDARFVEQINSLTLKWLPVPLSPIFNFEPASRRKVGRTAIFVGAFNETKGWDAVRSLIYANDDWNFILVSKYRDDEPRIAKAAEGRVVLHRQVDQNDLCDLYDEASVFVLGSPYETQCLAALEAASRGLPIVMPPTGVLGELPAHLRVRVGEFDPDIEAAFNRLVERIDLQPNALDPRSVVDDLGFLGSEPLDLWVDEVLHELENSFLTTPADERFPAVSSRIRQGRLLWRRIRREIVLPGVRLIRRNIRSSVKTRH